MLAKSYASLDRIIKKLNEEGFDINGEYGDLDITFDTALAEALSSGRKNPIDLKDIRNRALGRDRSTRQKLGAMVLNLFYNMSGPRKPRIVATDKRTQHLAMIMDEAERELNVKYKGDHISRTDITPQRLMSALAEISVSVQLKQSESTQIVKMKPSLYPYSLPQCVSILPDNLETEEAAFVLWANAKTSKTLQRNPGASDQAILEGMKDQLLYFKLAYKSNLVPKAIKEKTHKKLGGKAVIVQEEDFMTFFNKNLREILILTREVVQEDEGETSRA